MDCQSSRIFDMGMTYDHKHDQKRLISLGKRIKAIRNAKALTQEKLAELTEYDPTYLSMLERGKRNPPFLTLCRLAEEMGVTVEEFFKGLDKADRK